MFIEASKKLTELYPFILSWLEKRVEEIRGLPEKIERQGVPKGEVFPLTQAKALFALTEAFREMIKFNLQAVAKDLGISYQTARHWRSDDRVSEAKYGFIIDFHEDFLTGVIEKVSNWIEGKGLIEETYKLVADSYLFRGEFLEIFLDSLRSRIQENKVYEQFLVPIFVNQLPLLKGQGADESLKLSIKLFDSLWGRYVLNGYDELIGQLEAGNIEEALIIARPMREAHLNDIKAKREGNRRLFEDKRRK